MTLMWGSLLCVTPAAHLDHPAGGRLRLRAHLPSHPQHLLGYRVSRRTYRAALNRLAAGLHRRVAPFGAATVPAETEPGLPRCLPLRVAQLHKNAVRAATTCSLFWKPHRLLSNRQKWDAVCKWGLRSCGARVSDGGAFEEQQSASVALSVWLTLFSGRWWYAEQSDNVRGSSAKVVPKRSTRTLHSNPTGNTSSPARSCDLSLLIFGESLYLIENWMFGMFVNCFIQK